MKFALSTALFCLISIQLFAQTRSLDIQSLEVLMNSMDWFNQGHSFIEKSGLQNVTVLEKDENQYPTVVKADTRFRYGSNGNDWIMLFLHNGYPYGAILSTAPNVCLATLKSYSPKIAYNRSELLYNIKLEIEDLEKYFMTPAIKKYSQYNVNFSDLKNLTPASYDQTVSGYVDHPSSSTRMGSDGIQQYSSTEKTYSSTEVTRAGLKNTGNKQIIVFQYYYEAAKDDDSMMDPTFGNVTFNDNTKIMSPGSVIDANVPDDEQQKYYYSILNNSTKSEENKRNVISGAHKKPSYANLNTKKKPTQINQNIGNSKSSNNQANVNRDLQNKDLSSTNNQQDGQKLQEKPLNSAIIIEKPDENKAKPSSVEQDKAFHNAIESWDLIAKTNLSGKWTGVISGDNNEDLVFTLEIAHRNKDCFGYAYISIPRVTKPIKFFVSGGADAGQFFLDDINLSDDPGNMRLCKKSYMAQLLSINGRLTLIGKYESKNSQAFIAKNNTKTVFSNECTPGTFTLQKIK